jgi:hypothetical protein
MQVERRFVWSDDRADDHDEIRSAEVSRLVLHHGVWFQLRSWDVRYAGGEARVTEAIYDESTLP